MKIAVVGTRGFPGVQGGVETYCEHLYPLLVEKGCEVTVFARKPYLSTKTPYEYKGVRVIPLDCPRNKYSEAFFHTFRALLRARRLKPDILHLHAIGPSFFAPLARLLGMKVVMTHQGPDYMRKKWGRPARVFLRLSEYLGVRCSNHVVIVSGYIGERIKYIGQKQISVIPNGVDEAAYVPCDGMITKCGLVPGKYILTVGRLVPEKGFVDLISAYERLLCEARQSAQNGAWKLVIVGEADHADAYSRMLKARAQKSGNIVLTGFLSGRDLGEIYSNAGMFVIPSYHEGLPLALLEALSYGLSCVVSDIPAHRGLDLSADRLFTAGDIEGLRERLKQRMGVSLTQEERLSQIAYIRHNYNWEYIAQEMLGVYQRVISSLCR